MEDETNSSTPSTQSLFAEFEPGKLVFEKFKIIEKVGSGGMGVVYKANNQLLQRTVALKVMPGDFLSPADLVRFQNEARVLSRLEHASISGVFDFGIGEGKRPYLAMEFIEGPTLQSLLEENGQVPLDLFFDVFIQICSGLVHAHSKEIIHRDVKASNIILSANECEELRAVLVDFGVAKIESKDMTGRLTSAGAFIGSPLCVSPEQIAGEPARAASDIYSLSCVMFHALTGEPPFVGESILETLTMHREQEIPADRLFSREGLSEELCDLVLQGLAKEPSHRPESAERVLQELIKLNEAFHRTADGDSASSGESAKQFEKEELSQKAASYLSDTNTGICAQREGNRGGKKKIIVLIVLAVAAAPPVIYYLATANNKEVVETRTASRLATMIDDRPDKNRDEIMNFGTTVVNAKIGQASKSNTRSKIPLVGAELREVRRLLGRHNTGADLRRAHDRFEGCLVELQGVADRELELQTLVGLYETKHRLGLHTEANALVPIQSVLNNGA